MTKITYVFLVYVENPFTGKVQLKKICQSLKLAKKWKKNFEEKNDTFVQIEVMPLEQGSEASE